MIISMEVATAVVVVMAEAVVVVVVVVVAVVVKAEVAVVMVVAVAVAVADMNGGSTYVPTCATNDPSSSTSATSASVTLKHTFELSSDASTI
jgi:hypothetical protein